MADSHGWKVATGAGQPTVKADHKSERQSLQHFRGFKTLEAEAAGNSGNLKVRRLEFEMHTHTHTKKMPIK